MIKIPMTEMTLLQSLKAEINAFEVKIEKLEVELDVIREQKRMFQREHFGVGDGDKLNTSSLITIISHVMDWRKKESGPK